MAGIGINSFTQAGRLRSHVMQAPSTKPYGFANGSSITSIEVIQRTVPGRQRSGHQCQSTIQNPKSKINPQSAIRNPKSKIRPTGGSLSELGFTLLELIVAVTLVVVMAVGVWSALNLCIRAWTRGIEAIDANQRERSTHDLVRKQIASAYPLIPSTVFSLSGEQNLLNTLLAGSTPVFSGGEKSLRFVSPNSLLSVDSTGLVLVTYEVEVDSNDNIYLVQREAPYVGQNVEDGWFTSSAYVFFNLKELTFEYYSSGDTDNPAEWFTEWDIAGRRRLPEAVRISMLYKDTERGSPGLQMVIPLRAQYSLQNQPGQQLLQRQQIRNIQQRQQQSKPGQQSGGQAVQPRPKQTQLPKAKAGL